MRRLFPLLFILITLTLQPAQAAGTITLTEPTHRSSSGIFFDNSLAELISPAGRLGILLFDRSGRNQTWIIDVALLEEIADLADGYTYLGSDGKEVVVPELVLADIWINTLKSATKGGSLFALPYGNPSVATLSRIAPQELNVYRTLAQERLSVILGKPAKPTTQSGSASPSDAAINTYLPLRNSMEIVNTVVTLKSIEDQRLKLAQLLNTELDKDRLNQLRTDLRNSVDQTTKKVRVSGGNYTITSQRYELPVTIINSFDQQVNLDVRITPTNSRVLIGNIPRVSIGAQSQLQIKVPLNIIASGDTTLRIQLWTPAGERIGEQGRIPLRLTVISSSTTWFATTMALILIFALITQSVRRVKRRRKNG